ncbi:MAG: response regulator transcription factor [Clostridia bacterium]|nr:response regulator transcription factor [Clostridia bacterium]MBQ6803866.1 response regulator transcription factor [Clostridia bacterium]MDD6683324.1 LytTR family DNA-binding domain-containing protein [Clostridiales bacterium]
MKENALIPVLLADDDPGMRLILRKKIQATEGFCVIAEAATGDEAMALFEKCAPRVVFLDVDMPGKTGIECARLIQDQNPGCILIFATGHEEYMGEAFEVYAFDYLVKPFRLDRLEQTLQRIQARLAHSPMAPLPGPRALPIRKTAGRLMLRHREGVSFIDMMDILLVQREERSTVVYTGKNERYVLSETLSEMESRLDGDIFFRCHKSYIINLRAIRDITPYGRWTYVVRLEGTEHDALITHEKYEELEQRFA